MVSFNNKNVSFNNKITFLLLIKTIRLTKWMIPAAVSHTEMNIEMSCANLKEFFIESKICVVLILKTFKSLETDRVSFLPDGRGRLQNVEVL